MIDMAIDDDIDIFIQVSQVQNLSCNTGRIPLGGIQVYQSIRYATS